MPGIAAKIHEDFRALITDDSPAIPGEVIHLYATGLGPVTQPQQTGVPASGPVPLVEQRPCTDGSTLLYAGLAPGLIGYYQVDARLPASLTPRSHRLVCAGVATDIPTPPLPAP